MASRDDLARDFSFLKEKVLAVLIFGSSVKKKGRDLDVCIVSGADPKEVLKDVFLNVDTSKYDVWIFEELPLYMKMEVIDNHEIVFCKEKAELYEYFYFFRKLWKDQKRRNSLSKEDIKRTLTRGK